MDPKISAVIVLHEKQSDSLVLTKRSTLLRDHPGEVCFPGGRWQSEDTDFSVTALRELYEELGIDRHRVSLIKELQLVKTLKGIIIHPWLATIDTIEPYDPNPYEVSDVILVPMKDVRKLTNYKELLIERNGEYFTSIQFTANQHFIWGATVKIMRQLFDE